GAGVSVSDPYSELTGQPLSLTLSSDQGTFGVHGGSGGTVTGQGTSSITITGNVDEINSYLNDDWFGDLAANLGLSKVQLAAAIAGVTGLAAIITASGLALYYAIQQLLFYKPACTYGSHIHIFDADGQFYDFNAVGEFELALSTKSGDSFELQARLEPWQNSQAGSVVTQLGAAVGDDRVTFDVHRSSTVWIDGSPSTLTPTQPVVLPGGKLEQLSANTYQITWNTGESITVTNNGSYLDVNVNPAYTQLVGLL